MTVYRSTILNLLDRHCPRALDFAEAGTFRETDLFQPGIAAHAILQAIGEHGPNADHREIADAVARQLVTVGRSFDGNPEPPMSPAAATAGRDIALRYLATHVMPVSAKYELGLAVNSKWEPVPYGSKDAYYQAILDVLETLETESDDGYPIFTVTATDWKSAWPTDASELETIQLKGQAALVWAHYPSATSVVRSVVNLRTGARYSEETVMDEDGAAVVAGWRADIGHAVAAAEVRQADGKRTARPGAGCMGCPYLAICPDSIPVSGDTPEQMAMEWMVYKAHVEALTPKLKALAEESAIVTTGGTVGYYEKTKRDILPEAARAIASDWFLGAATDAEAGLLTALKLGSGNVDSVAKTLHPFDRSDTAWKEKRAALMVACVGEKTVAEFGVVP